MPVKVEVSQQLTGHWKVGLFETPCKAPVPFLLGCCCSCCFYAAQQRHQILDITGEQYVCCGGMCPCGPLGEPQARECAYLEGCCCNGLAVAGNRFMMQTRFDKMNTACDDCILWFTCLASWVVCILQCFIEVPDEITFMVDCLVMTVNGCMLAQHAVEIEEIKKNGYAGPPSSIVGMLPPTQQKMIQGASGGNQSANMYGKST
mmetsp:Transcript_13339/g.30420  ORF Transcript_13339/g.30420 Transcript_13339/m.30420 type:complete len:204 (+) Transcript_13339:91-702(+)